MKILHFARALLTVVGTVVFPMLFFALVILVGQLAIALTFSSWVQFALALLLMILCPNLAWRSYRSKKTPYLPRVLRTYLYLNLSFSGAYYLIYEHDADQYVLVIASPQLQQKRDQYLALTDSTIAVLNKVRRKIEEQTEATFERKKLHRRGTTWSLGEGLAIEYGYRKKRAFSRPSLQWTSVWLTVLDDDFHHRIDVDDVSEFYLNVRRTPVGALVLDETITKSASLEHLQTIQERLARRAERYRDFTILDFVYFGFVLMSYGDIVPNSTLVRVVVVLQVIFAFTIAIFSAGQSPPRI